MFVRARGKGGSVSEPETFEVATKCLEAWSSGDFATARTLLRDDVTFVGPLGSGGGVESYMNCLVDLSHHVTRAEPIKVVVDGDDACIIYDLVTDAGGSVPTSDWYHVQDGKISSVRAYFDTRALGAGSGSGSGTHDQQSAAPFGALAARRILPSVLPALVSAEMELAESST
jgi:ketosteroid isomerase-like protein